MTNTNRSIVLKELKKQGERLLGFCRWVIISGVIGVAVGWVGVAFYHTLKWATTMRTEHSMLILGLPFGGLIIVMLYRALRREDDHGTNSVISAVRSEEKLHIRTTPLIFVSTIITHLFGGSSGREGAALQMGGSIGNGLGKVFGLNEKDTQVAVMCGRSACFAALFGTPIAATFFAMEVVSVGIMYYSALVPCVFSSLIAAEMAKIMGVGSEAMTIGLVPEFTAVNTGKITLIAILCAAVSIAFCVMMHSASEYSQKWVKNPYIRIFAGGIFVTGIHLLIGISDYMGAGMEIIEHTMHGEVRPEAFVYKMVLTAVTLGVGYKGGEIVPSFFVGATFGCLMGQLLGVSPSMCAAVGMIALFCGVTNCPITSLLLAFEIFGMEGIYFILIGVAVSYMLSGYYSLYHSQKIMYSKYDAEYRGDKL